MKFTTGINIEPSSEKITYNDPVLFIGSCFAASIGSYLAEGKMPVLINPSGTVYNPSSVIRTLSTIIPGKQFELNDLYNHNGTWLSFSHHTDYSSDDPSQLLAKINNNSALASQFLKKARFLFITFGTARVFRLKQTGGIVSNCHKLPADFFERELLTVDEIVHEWNGQLDILKELYPELKVIFTVSPVRHWKDGAHGNQVSKSVLFLAIEQLQKHITSPGYFPAYEIIIDELRDYRFYEEDMLHPSKSAINYIRESFSACYMDEKTMKVWKEASKITKATKHRFINDNSREVKIFAENMLFQISEIEKKVPGINFSEEKTYFQGLPDVN
jgi:hypothetical protein